MNKDLLKPFGLCVFAFFLNGCNGDNTETNSNVNLTNLKSLQLSVVNEPIGVISASTVLPVGSNLQYQAIAIYNDGSPQKDVTNMVTWHSDAVDTVAIDSSGVVTAKAEGDTYISATLDGVSSNTLPLHTSSAALTSLRIEGKSVAIIDSPIELKAIAVYSNNISQDVSDFAKWESTLENEMTIDKGYLTASVAGNVDVKASYLGLSNEIDEYIIDLSDITDISLEMSELDTDLALGSTVQLSSMLTIQTEDDAVEFLMGEQVEYSSDNSAVHISDTGLLSADAVAEDVTITATTTLYDTVVTDTQVVNVTKAQLAPMTLSCDETTIYLGLFSNCVATMHHVLEDSHEVVSEDVSALANWSVTNDKVLNLSNAGQVKGLSVGVSSVEVEYQGQKRTQSIQVLGAGVVSVDVQSDSDSMLGNSELSMRAMATMVNDATQDVTPLVNWSVNSEEFATIDQKGVLSSSNVEKTEVVTVNAATIDIDGTPISDDKNITLSKEPLTICGIGVDDTDKGNAKGNCLKVATDARGKWYTSTPSIAVMESLGFTLNNSEYNEGDTYASIDGEFARFRQDGENVTNPADGGIGNNGQADRWCKKLTDIKFGGKERWYRPTESELKVLQQHIGDLSQERGWPTHTAYATSTSGTANYNINFSHVYLDSGAIYGVPPSHSDYVACTADLK
ncbi:Ig-like domain-containing protein [Vibrio alginolyticus]|uniref:Ig-like domain-containing protein n=1 Tax=Vibrio alginolyticus TaxID=663 RepID=UPI000720987F|nr:Ig-like domain-containing protein [Vibrio alginolyticus]ALR95741.1 hypothetical protein AT730_26255 [Vibrio alginolyticus]MBY7710960.1 Ig-like domain-containing protein [Vibrio alginolyticus]